MCCVLVVGPPREVSIDLCRHGVPQGYGLGTKGGRGRRPRLPKPPPLPRRCQPIDDFAARLTSEEREAVEARIEHVKRLAQLRGAVVVPAGQETGDREELASHLFTKRDRNFRVVKREGVLG